MRFMLAVLALAAIAGCTSVRPMYSAPGEKQFSVGCPPAFPQQCRDRAAKECGGPNYEVVASRAGYEEHRMIVRC